MIMNSKIKNRTSSQIEETRKGSFMWKIDKCMNTNYGYLKSSQFKFGRCNSFLCIPSCLNGFTIGNVREIDLNTENSSDDAVVFSEKTVYELNMLDRHGKKFLTTKGITRRENKIIMMVFSIEYLRKYRNELLTKGDTLTFHLTWNPYSDTILSDMKPVVSNNLLKTLSDDLKSFYKSQSGTDCVLKIGETQFPAHRAVLSARSAVFAAMFHHDTSESRTGEVDILDVEAKAMRDVLYYIYSGKIQGMSEDTAVPMYNVADKYALIELRDICQKFLMQNLTTENVCDVAVLAHTYAETELENAVVDFIKERLDDFEESKNWIQFSKLRPSLALKLVRSAWKAFEKDVNNTSTH